MTRDDDDDEDRATVVITLRDIYDKIIMVERSVQAMDAPVKTIADHESRIRGLERWRYSQPASLVLAVAAIVMEIKGRAQ